MVTAQDVSGALRPLGDSAIARHSQGFFKTAPGEYAHGDLFLGIRVPVVRAQAHRFRRLPRLEAIRLLASKYHEERFCALAILVDQFKRGDEDDRGWIYERYLANTNHINNWDLVDASAHKIVGPWLADRDRQILYTLAASPSLWERRIAIIATHHFISNGEFDDTLDLSEQLLNDPHDLIHKAVGWMLREVGKRDQTIEEVFLLKHQLAMPRTMLRYAIEKFSKSRRKQYLGGYAC